MFLFHSTVCFWNLFMLTPIGLDYSLYLMSIVYCMTMSLPVQLLCTGKELTFSASLEMALERLCYCDHPWQPRVVISSHLRRYFVLLDIKVFATLVGERISHCGLNLLFPDYQWDWASFETSSLNILFIFFAHLLC